MDRLEIPEDGTNSAWVEAVERGDEVVITREGVPVVELKPPVAKRPVIDLEKLADFHSRLGKLRGGGAALIRQLRDEERF